MKRAVILTQREYNELVQAIIEASEACKSMRQTRTRTRIEGRLDEALKILEGEDRDMADLKKRVRDLERRPTYPY